jgi:hypothetical protein
MDFGCSAEALHPAGEKHTAAEQAYKAAEQAAAAVAAEAVCRRTADCPGYTHYYSIRDLNSPFSER